MSGLVYGAGINNYNERVNIGGRPIKSYQIWQDILRRCYSEKYKNKNPTYMGTSMCKEWLLFSNFKKWFDANYPDELARELDIRFDIDKDLLSENSKVYSPDTCVFLPKKVNVFLSNKKSNNTSGYTGVSWHKTNRSWRVRINEFGTNKNKYIGYFKNLEDASIAYELARAVEAEKAKEYLRELGYNEEIISKIK